jgi:hypothetical protein
MFPTKEFILTIIISICITSFITCTYTDIKARPEIYYGPNYINEDSQEIQPVIIWNDDLESLPKEGELITLEMVKNDTIYIGPKD